MNFGNCEITSIPERPTSTKFTKGVYDVAYEIFVMRA